MARYNDGTRYNSGARYNEVTPINIRPMSQIKIAVSSLPIGDKILRGRNIITKSTNNPDVPGNAVSLAAFSAKQTAFEASVADAIAKREAAKNATIVQDENEAEWRASLTLLAAFTENATGGQAAKFTTAGFEARGNNTPAPVPDQVLSLNVFLNGGPGHSRLTWEGVDRADGYLVQGSVDPITPTSWTQSIVSKKTAFMANGAIAGQKYWYRVAAFNSAGQGEWSAVAERPVM